MKKTNLIFLHKVLKAIADSIIKVFIPLFILKETGKLEYSLMYLAINGVVVILLNLLLKKFLQKYGVISIMLHFVPIIITEALLSLLPINLFVLISCSVLMGVSQTLYSVPLNLIFAFGDKETNVAKFQIATNVGKLGFILISGFMLGSTIQNSFLILSIVSTLFYITSVVPLMFAYNMLKQNYIDVSNAHLNTEKQPISNTDKLFVLFHIGFGSFQACLDNIIPLYLYVNNLSFTAVTIVIAIIEVLRIVSNYIAKWLVGKGKQRLSCIISCSIFTVCVACLVIFKNPVVLYVFSCLCSLCFPLTFVPMFKKFCNHLTTTNNVFDGLVYRDVYIFSFRPLLYGTYYLGLGLVPCFVTGLIAMGVMFYSEFKLTSKRGV